jgi:hypothetical protein
MVRKVEGSKRPIDELIAKILVKDWDMRLIDKATVPRMPWHDISLCMVSVYY